MQWDQRRNVILLIALVFAVAFLLTIGSLTLLFRWDLASRREGQEERARFLTRRVDLVLDRYRGVASTLTRSETVLPVLRGERPRDDRELLLVAETVLRSFDASYVYFMDASGTVVASASASGLSLTGNNYAFRPYFRQAMEGYSTLYPALGVTTMERGLYFSAPVRSSEGSRLLGVVVIKVGLEAIDRLLKAHPDETMLLSPDGIVFAASRGEWLYRAALPLAPEARERLRATRQFADRPLDPLPFSVQGGMVRQEKRDFLRVRMPVALPGWAVVTLRPWSARPLLPAAVLLTLGFAAAAGLLSMSIVVHARKRALARRFEERTEDWIQAGRQLEREKEQHERTASALAASERRFQAIFEGAEDAVFIKDAASRLVLANPVAARLAQASSAFIPEPPSADGPPSDAASLAFEQDRRVLQGETVRLERTVPFGNTQRVFSFIKVPLREGGAGVTGVIGIARDVTPMKEAESALIRAERLAAVGTLAGGVAHEFNNVNTSVLGYAEFLLDNKEMENSLHRDCLERIRHAALRAKGITHKLLTFAGEQDSRPRRGNLKTVAEDAAAMVAREFEVEGVGLSLRLDETPDTEMDPSQIEQVLLNLLINAGHAVQGRADRRVEVRTYATEDSVCAEVRDTGCGISGVDLPKIFSPFFSTKGEHAHGPGPQSRARGSGLGLSVSHAIVEGHGGELSVESAPERGSRFLLRLPRTPPPPDAEPPAGEEKRDAGARHKADAAARPETPKRILIVDDEPDTRDLLSRILNRSGFEPLAFDSAGEALETALGDAVDLILLDLRMPDLSGGAFLRRLREGMGREAPPVLVVSGWADLEAEGVKEAWVEGVLAKPFELHAVVRAVRDALRDGEGGPAAS